MTDDWKHARRVVTEKQWIWFVAVIGLLTRLPLIGASAAENTDGILSLTYFSKDFVTTPRFVILPGYPLLLLAGHWLGLDGILWGRCVSCLFGLLFLIPLWRYARRWMGAEMSAMVCLMALFSPLLWQWSLKVMPDTTFLFLFWFSLERLTAAYLDRSPRAWVESCLSGAAAACVRPEGLLLLPWILVLESRVENQQSWVRKILFFISWILPLFLIREKIFLLFSAYQEGAGIGPQNMEEGFPFFNFVYHFYAYLSQPFYVFTPLVYLFAILGLAKMFGRNDKLGESFRKIQFQFYAVFFVSRLIPVTYQDRHMMPFLPILIVAAGYQLETFFNSLQYPKDSMMYHLIKNGVLSVTLLYSAAFSSAAIGGQTDSFGDIKRSAEFLKTLPANAVIYSDEIPKTQYWAGRTVTPLDYSQKPFMPHPGEYVILHSFYTPRINSVGETMTARFGAVLIHSDSSTVVPVMTDLMQDFKLQNRIPATGYRFSSQFFQSVVYRIGQ